MLSVIINNTFAMPLFLFFLFYCNCSHTIYITGFFKRRLFLLSALFSFGLQALLFIPVFNIFYILLFNHYFLSNKKATPFFNRAAFAFLNFRYFFAAFNIAVIFPAPASNIAGIKILIVKIGIRILKQQHHFI